MTQPHAVDDQFKAVFDDLCRIAARIRGQIDPDHTLSATEMVSELWLRLIEDGVPVQTPEHLRALARKVMRWMLVNRARARIAAKRGGGALVTLAPDIGNGMGMDEATFIDLHEELERLAKDPKTARQAAIIEGRIFGFSNNELAEELGCGLTTIKNDWVLAKARLNWILLDKQQFARAQKPSTESAGNSPAI